MKEKTDICIVTVKEDEFLEVKNLLGKTHGSNNQAQDQPWLFFSIKTIQENELKIALARIPDQGTKKSQSFTNRVISELKPSWVLFVGIAGGIASEDFSLGDVVVSKRICDLTLEVSKPDGERTYSLREESIHGTAKNFISILPAIITDQMKDWNKNIEKRPTINLEDGILDKKITTKNAVWKGKIKDSLMHNFGKKRAPKAIIGAIASSDRLVKDIKITESWITVAREILAVDMELTGALEAAGNVLPLIGIKGISDIVGYKRNEEWTIFACKSAAAFTYSLLCSGKLTMSQDDATDEPTQQEKKKHMPTPKIKIFIGIDLQFYFRLSAANGEPIFTSEGYTSKSGCKNGIDSVKKNAVKDEQYKRKKASNGEFYFNLVAVNGEVIGKSETYKTEQGREKGIEAVKSTAPDAPVEDAA
ncbi:MAG: DUF1508 domain-containing protein [Pelolinea sp.]|nr:DUF1508 domain-containing protein [Pelolinea sp.]